MSARETYRAMAAHYDAWQVALGGEFAKLIAPRLDLLLADLRVRPRRLLDLACGTGSLLKVLSNRRLRLAGVDASPEMLAVARTKLGNSVPLVTGRMEAIPLRGRWDVITCFYDSLNHITSPAALECTFQEVARLLAPNGLFVFDTNNRHCYRTLWRSPSEIRTATASVTVTPHFSDAAMTGTALISIETSLGTRVVTTLHERCYEDTAIAAALQRGSLRILRAQPFNPFAPGDTPPIKTLWVAAHSPRKAR